MNKWIWILAGFVCILVAVWLLTSEAASPDVPQKDTHQMTEQKEPQKRKEILADVPEKEVKKDGSGSTSRPTDKNELNDREESVWRAARSRDKRLYYEKYLEEYPGGRYAVEAGERMHALLPKAIRNLESNMVKVEGGGFFMGCTDEQQGDDCESDEFPVNWVELSDYSIGRYEVTQGQWEAVMGSTVKDLRDSMQAALEAAVGITDTEKSALPGEGSDFPIYYVSGDDVLEFFEKLNKLTGGNYRLPTEAEWEYAARGGQKSKGYKYSGSNDLSEVAWFIENSEETSHKVGSVGKANELGLYDMSGNVWEWCSNWYGNYGMIRGGSWWAAARDCRVSERKSASTSSWLRSNTQGFRIASD